MKSKTRKLRDKALRLGLPDPTTTSGVAREEIASFYKRGGKTATKQEKIAKKLKREKYALKKAY